MGCFCDYSVEIEDYKKIEELLIASHIKNEQKDETKCKKEETKSKKEETKFKIITSKESLRKIALSCPSRNDIGLYELINYLNEKTKGLDDISKAYVVFCWMAENIAYDTDSYFGYSTAVYTPEEVYRKGQSVCSGYSSLYKYIANSIGLKVKCIIGYVKGYGYVEGEIISDTNHEWNILEVNNKFYLIDSTWGAGYVNERKFKKKFKEHYFCTPPEQLITTHLPSNSKWQLLEPPITIKEFLKRVMFWEDFYLLFNSSNTIYYNPKVGNKYTFRFFKKSNKVELLIKLDYLINNVYQHGEECKYLVKKRKDYIDIVCLFKLKGKYKLDIYGKDETKKLYESLVTYYPECTQNSNMKNFDFQPEDYELQNDTFDEILNNFKCDSISHKEISFKAKQKEKLSFKFKKDSDIFISDVEIYYYVDNENKAKLEKEIKYIIFKKNLDIEAIFNKKGKYNICISYSDESIQNSEYTPIKKINYFPYKEEDEKQEFKFSFEEIAFIKPFEEVIQNLELDYLSHNSQAITVNNIETFKFKNKNDNMAIYFEYKSIDNKGKILSVQKKDNDSECFHLAFNAKNKYILKFLIYIDSKPRDTIIYLATCENDPEFEITIPYSYDNKIEMIEPVFNNLKKGREVTFKMKSNEEKIVLINDNWNYIEKDPNGLFELSFIPKVDEIVVGNLENRSCKYVKTFKVHE